MLTLFAAAALGVATLGPPAAPDVLQPPKAAARAATRDTDQTIAVQRGARLDLENFAGEIVVHAWDKDSVRVEATHGARDRVAIRAVDAVVTVRAEAHLGAPRSVDFEVTVPRWMRVKLNGVYTDMSVDGTQAEIAIETVRGDITVRGGSGFISLKSIEGQVSAEGSRGRVEANSVNEGVRLVDIAGEISAETVNGSITLERIDSNSVDVGTVNGHVAFSGIIKDAGRYRLGSHNGDITLTIPEPANATVNVRTFNGEFESSFAAKPTEVRRNRRFSLTLGTGSAQIDLESFGGTVRLQRAGAAVTHKPRK